MGDKKVLIDLAIGLEDPERVTVASLVGGAALQRGDQVAMLLTTRLCASACPTTPKVLPATAVRRSLGFSNNTLKAGANFLCARFCFNARKLNQSALVSNAQLAGATALLEWLGEAGCRIFSY